MKFTFDEKNYSNMGFVLKHGNFDNVVVFFDEEDNAANYKVDLFRTDVTFENEGFLTKCEITEHVFICRNRNGDETGEDTNYEVTNIGKPIFLNGNLIDTYISQNNSMSIEPKDRNSIKPDCVTTGYGIAYKFRKIKEVSFDDIKFITSLECSRNELYCKIDFLPVGQYFAVLSSEERDGTVSKKSIPYYFKIKAQSNDELLKAIHGAGRAAGRNTVTI